MHDYETPPVSLLRLDAVVARTGLKKTAIYNLMNRGLFPRPRHIAGTRVSVWSDLEIRTWISNTLNEEAA